MIEGINNLPINVAVKHGIGLFLRKAGIKEDQEGVVKAIVDAKDGFSPSGVVITVDKGVVHVELVFLKGKWKFSLSIKRDGDEGADRLTTYSIDTVWREDAAAWCEANIAPIMDYLK